MLTPHLQTTPQSALVLAAHAKAVQTATAAVRMARAAQVDAVALTANAVVLAQTVARCELGFYLVYKPPLWAAFFLGSGIPNSSLSPTMA